jgi:hypothetical protein
MSGINEDSQMIRGVARLEALGERAGDDIGRLRSEVSELRERIAKIERDNERLLHDIDGIAQSTRIARDDMAAAQVAYAKEKQSLLIWLLMSLLTVLGTVVTMIWQPLSGR